MITLYDHNGNAMNFPVKQTQTDLQQRNEIRLKEAKEKLGERYLLHPANTRGRLETPR